jgi:TolB-like protein
MPSIAVRTGLKLGHFPRETLEVPEVAVGQPSLEIPRKPAERRLDSWKEIAAYLDRDVTTVQRWEKREGMPVHRHQHDKRGSVYALSSELDAWIESRRSRTGEPETEVGVPIPPISPDQGTNQTAAPGARRTGLWFALGAVVCLSLIAAVWFATRRRVPAVASPAIRSLAVLPFRNLSGNPAQEYLAEGITEALIGRLSEIHDLRVTSYTSVMRFRNPQQSVPEIANSLGVDAVLEGSVIREGSRIRVTAQLIRGATDGHLWSGSYDREVRDSLALESDLAQLVAGKVEVTITEEERPRLTAARPVAPEVYESYLKGQFAINNGNGRADIEQSIRYFEEAIQKDPTFAPAYLGVADAYNNLGTDFAGVPPSETRPKVFSYVRQALALDPNLVEAHVILANVLEREWHWAEAESEYRHALALNPHDALAYEGLATWLACQGRTEEAVARMRQARALDPVAIPGGDISWMLFHARRYEEAIRESRSSVATEPDNALGLFVLAFPLIANGQASEAIPLLEKAVALSHGSPAAIAILIGAYAHAARREDALRLLAELKQRRKADYIPPGTFVSAYLGLGDKEQAFYWLEQAYQERSNLLQFVKVHPYFDPIRSDPRFADLVRRVGLG